MSYFKSRILKNIEDTDKSFKRKLYDCLKEDILIFRKKLIFQDNIKMMIIW